MFYLLGLKVPCYYFHLNLRGVAFVEGTTHPKTMLQGVKVAIFRSLATQKRLQVPMGPEVCMLTAAVASPRRCDILESLAAKVSLFVSVVCGGHVWR